MDTKVQKIKIEYAKYRNNGFIIDFLVKSLEIEQKEEKLQNRYQRFIKEDDISADEYNDTLNTVIEDILYCFFDSRDNKGYKYYEKYMKYFLSFYNTTKINIESLATSQKQLDFINIVTLFIPIFRLNIISEKTKHILAQILREKKVNAIKTLFSIINSLLGENQNIRELLFKVLDKNKAIGYDAINKNIDNWINGETIPNKEHINLISELSFYMPKFFSKNQLKTCLNISKIIQQLYDKSINYFGENLTEILIKHYKYFDIFHGYYERTNKNKDKFETVCKYDFKSLDFKLVGFYLDIYFYNKIDLHNYFFKKSFLPDIHIPEEHNSMVSFIKDNNKYEDLLYKIEEKDFFEKIDTILPVKCLNGDISEDSLSYLDEKIIDNKFKTYSEYLVPIYIGTLPSEEKTSEDEKKLLQNFTKFEKKYEAKNNPYYSFLKARYYAQKKEYKKATKYYLISLKYGKNCMGEHIQSVIKEGLFVSAQDTRKNQVDLINAKSSFTKFYKEAYFYKLLDSSPDEINMVFLNDMKKEFDIYFRKLFLYHDIKKKEIFTNITPNFSIGLTEDMENIIIDYTKPNKLIKSIYPNPIPQLLHCSQNSNYDAIVKLIHNGADVNLLKQSDNASALIFAFPSQIMQDVTEERNKIMQLLISLMSEDALNTKLIKQKDTALSYAMTYGLVDIVQLLIQNGVNLNQRVTISEYSPLYMSIHHIGYAKNGLNYNKNSKFRTSLPFESAKERKILAKANKFSNGIFDEERDKDLSFKTKEEKGYFEDFRVLTAKEYMKREKEYYEIFHLIINELDNVDIPQESTTTDNVMTPLIFATELNEVELVKKLLGKDANIDYYTTEGARAYDYAKQNNNHELMDLLE